MSSEPDLEIRYDGTYYGLLLAFFGMVMGGFGLALLINPSHSAANAPPPLVSSLVIGVLAIIAVGFAAASYAQFTDKTVKLSLTADGIKDLRTGEFIKWTDIRNVRLYTVYTNAKRTSDTLYVMLPSGDEKTFNVHSLDRSPENVVTLVKNRALDSSFRKEH